MSNLANLIKDDFDVQFIVICIFTFYWKLRLLISLLKIFFLQKGTKAPQAAGRIHTDMERFFIMAEVMSYEDFRTEGSEAAVKVIIITFIFN